MTATCLDLFAGCGGFSLGFKQAGFDPTYALDFSNEAVVTYSSNIGDHIENIDVYQKDLSKLPEVDIIIGSPPCQGFSLEGKRRASDERSWA